MASDVSENLRRLVAERAGYRCEYCLLPEAFALHRHEPDHIVPRQHDGATEPSNLALACLRCNRHKGPNVGSIDPITASLVPLFNPRTQEWRSHFEWDGVAVRPLTAVGRVTIRVLQLNAPDRLEERQRLFDLGAYFESPDR